MYQVSQISKGKIKTEERQDLRGLRKSEGVAWVHINAKTEAELEEIIDVFGFHRLAIEDCVDRQQRPKVEEYGDCTLVIVKDFELNSNLVVNQLALFVCPNALVTVSNIELEEVTKVRGNLGKWKPGVLKPDFIAYRILDRIVDSYFPIIDGIEDDIEAVENLIVRKPTSKSISSRIFKVKRHLLGFRKAVWPMRDVFSMLSKSDIPSFSKKNRIYYRDIYDHVILVIDLVETYRDLTSGIQETYLSTISNNMNEVMKVLTVIATIFIPLTFITGLYGMNFRPDASPLNMPELNWYFGYPFALIMMLAIGVGMLYYFRKKSWI